MKYTIICAECGQRIRGTEEELREVHFCVGCGKELD